MRILVTGGAGFIGSHLVERLARDGHDVIAADCLLEASYSASIKRNRMNRLAELPSVQTLELDLRSDPIEAAVDGVECVINEAAMPGLSRSWNDVELYNSCNFLAVDRLVRACMKASVGRFVQASTSSVYGRYATGDETSPLRPISPYGVTKLAAENLLAAYHDSVGLPFVTVRYFSVYGPRQRPDMAYTRICRALTLGSEIPIYGDGLQSRTNTFVADCVEGTVLALERGLVGETYNIGGNESITLLEAIDLLGRVFGVVPKTSMQPAIPGDQRATVANYAKAAEALGYSPKTEASQGLQAQAEWYLAEGRFDGA